MFRKVVYSGLIICVLLFGGCGPGQRFGPTETLVPTHTATATSTDTPTPTQTFTPTVTPTPAPGDTLVSPKDNMFMVFIPAGEFKMGREKLKIETTRPSGGPIHTVYTDAFWIDRHEVTNAQYEQCVADGDCYPPKGTIMKNVDNYYGEVGYDYFPVRNVSWYDARNYCEWAGRRLPREAEWEKAARGGLEGKEYPWGDEDPVCSPLSEFGANFDGDDCAVTGPLKVMSFRSNPYGLYDMAGNVWEWVADRYASDYYSHSPYENPPGPSSGDYRVLRGGAWFNSSRDLRVSNRFRHNPGYPGLDAGFRCAKSRSPSKQPTLEPINTATITSKEVPVGVLTGYPQLYSGPGRGEYEILWNLGYDVDDLRRGDLLEIIGQWDDCKYLKIITYKEVVGWIPGSRVSHELPCSELPELTSASIPPPPTPEPPTPEPAKVKVLIKNNTGNKIEIFLGFDLFVVWSGNHYISVVPGNYNYKINGCGTTKSGVKTLSSGDVWEIWCSP